MTAATFTLGDIRAASPCAVGWRKLLTALVQNHAAPDLTIRLSIGDVVVSNGRADALWCLRCLPPREAVRAVMPAVKRAAAHTSDPRVAECIAALDRWLAGDDSVDLKAAEAAAWAAAEAAAEAARAAAEAARAAARAAERNRQVDDLLGLFPPIILNRAAVSA